LGIIPKTLFQNKLIKKIENPLFPKNPTFLNLNPTFTKFLKEKRKMHWGKKIYKSKAYEVSLL
jgi:hypothetical protein